MVFSHKCGLNTRYVLSTVYGLLEAVDQFRQMYGGKASKRLETLIQDIRKAILHREKFHACIASTNFWAFPICEDGYLFQIAPKDIWRWLEKIS